MSLQEVSKRACIIEIGNLINSVTRNDPSHEALATSDGKELTHYLRTHKLNKKLKDIEKDILEHTTWKEIWEKGDERINKIKIFLFLLDKSDALIYKSRDNKSICGCADGYSNTTFSYRNFHIIQTDSETRFPGPFTRGQSYNIFSHDTRGTINPDKPLTYEQLKALYQDRNQKDAHTLQT